MTLVQGFLARLVFLSLAIPSLGEVGLLGVSESSPSSQRVVGIAVAYGVLPLL